MGALCAPLCRYFKPWKVEDERCGGWEWLQRNAIAGRLPEGWRGALQACARPGTLGCDELLNRAVCADCAFRIDGCDYRDPSGPSDAQPCGGVWAIDLLLAAGVLSDADLCSEEKG